MIPLLAGMAARRSIEANTGVLPGLKWPNDLVTEQGKVGGLLVEAADGDIIVGCGINLWWPQAPGGFAGVVNEDPGSELVVSVARDWADSLSTPVGAPSSLRSIVPPKGSGVFFVMLAICRATLLATA